MLLNLETMHQNKEVFHRMPRPGTTPDQIKKSNYALRGSAIVASSRYRQRAFASCMWRGLRQSGSNNLGLPTTITVVIAREVATLNRFRLYRNSIPRGASSGEDVVSE